MKLKSKLLGSPLRYHSKESFTVADSFRYLERESFQTPIYRQVRDAMPGQRIGELCIVIVERGLSSLVTTVAGASEANRHWSGRASAKWACLAALHKAWSQKTKICSDTQHFLRSCLEKRAV